MGEGEPFLLLHGWSSSAERWQNVLEMISKKGLKVIAPDLPGFGKSDFPRHPWGLDEYSEWLDGFIKNFPETQNGFYLAGHSFGGAVAANFVIKNQNNVKKLFLIAPSCIRKKTTKKSVLGFITKFLKNFKNVPLHGLIRRIFYRYIVGRSDYLSVSESMKDTYLTVISQDLSNELSKISIPTVIIWGDKDNFVPVKDAYFIKSQIKNSELKIIKDKEHMLHREAPEQLVKALTL